MSNEVTVINGTVTGVHLGSPMQDATPDKADDNKAYYVERNQNTRAKNYKELLDDQPTSQYGNAAPHQQYVTGADGVPRWEDRAVYKTTDRVHPNDAFGEELFPCTITTTAGEYGNSARNDVVAALYGFACYCDKREIWFDGTQYICDVKEIDGMPYFGATMDENGNVDFREYPFCIANSTLLTESAGEHTIDAYGYVTTKVSNYAPALIVQVVKRDGAYSLSVEDVAKIRNAWENNIPITISSSVRNLSALFRVVNVNESFIVANATINDYNAHITTCVQTFKCSDGSMSRESCAHIGSISENGDWYPLMYINNRWHKITVDSDGKLTATEVTE